jgi:DNA gyrase/topoisomerase IV subunit A
MAATRILVMFLLCGGLAVCWMATGVLYSSLISIFIFLIYRRCIGDWCNVSGAGQELSQFRTLLQETHRLRLELQQMLALEREEEENRHEQILKEINSMKSMLKEEEKRCSEFQREINAMKSQMRVQGGEHAQFQNAIDAATNMMNIEKKRYAKFSDEINSMATNQGQSAPMATN